MIENKLYDAMLRLADPTQAEGLSRFFRCGPGQYGEGDRFLGIKVPATRKVVKELWRECRETDPDSCLASPWHEVRLAALLVVVQKYHHERKNTTEQQHWVEYYLAHTAAINNWDLVDLTCYEIVGTWLLDKDARLLREMAQHGTTLWEQRIAMVSTMQFLRHGRMDETYEIADILLHHSHDLIQKAVGWMLREAGKRDGQRLRRWLASRYAGMPRTMLRYAIEKFPPDERQQYLHGLI